MDHSTLHGSDPSHVAVKRLLASFPGAETAMHLLASRQYSMISETGPLREVEGLRVQ